jgi:hypothetical protein
MQRFRFNLRSLFILFALVASVLGYAQWRRQNILREARVLESQGFTLVWEEHWADWVWPRVPSTAKFEYRQLAGDQWRIGSHVYAEHEIDALYAQASDRLHALGVKDVRLDRAGKRGNTYTSTSRGR